MNHPSSCEEFNEAGHVQAAATGTEPASQLSARTFSLEPGVERDHRKLPCTRCPWLTSTDLTEFSDEDMDMLRRANGCPGAEAPVNAPIVACHRDQPSTAHPLRWCAGFLAVVGEQHLGIRLALAFEALPPQAVNPPASWPELYPDLDALIAARAEQLGLPAPSAACKVGADEPHITTPTTLDTVGIPVPGGTHHDEQ
ncbi:DUF6283 family protein [Streptomyces sp. NPDC014872]|uniref:DUF6283 family protein n=1 Tax=Streptomyces sp. NPDC014872 TaxID=3364926 RepID=UPI0036F752B8